MYEFLALDLGSGRLLATWRWAAVRMRRVGRRADRALTPFGGELGGELVECPLLRLAREHLPRERLLLRARYRLLRGVRDHPEDHAPVAGGPLEPRAEDGPANRRLV